MRRIERTTQFKRDYKREKKGTHRNVFDHDNVFVEVLKMLIEDHDLPDKHRDHSLSGNWADHRDCHVKPDLVLIYRKPDDEILQLVRLGSHSELGL